MLRPLRSRLRFVVVASLVRGAVGSVASLIRGRRWSRPPPIRARSPGALAARSGAATVGHQARVWPYLTEYIKRFGECSRHEPGVEPEAYSPGPGIGLALGHGGTTVLEQDTEGGDPECPPQLPEGAAGPLARHRDGGSGRRVEGSADSDQCRFGSNSSTCVSRMLLPDGSRKDVSIPYGCAVGGSLNSTPRADSSL